MFLTASAVGQPIETDWLTSTVFGSLWRSHHTPEIGDTSYIEPSLRPYLPSRAFQDLANARHPKGTELAATLARMAGLIDEQQVIRSISSDSLLVLLSEDPTQTADAVAYCRLRLFDHLIGDWSRSPSDIHWIPRRGTQTTIWIPHPSPFQNAFTKYNGLLPQLLLMMSDYMTSWSPYPRSSMNGIHPLRYLDRRLLSSVPWSTWETSRRSIEHTLTPAVTDSIFYRVLGPARNPLYSQFRARIEKVSVIARDLHRAMSRFVEIYPRGRSDSLHVTVLSDRAIRVRSGWQDSSIQVFSSIDTDEIRFILREGKHTLWIQGSDDLSFDLITELGDDGSDVWSRISSADEWAHGAPGGFDVYRTPRSAQMDLDDTWGTRTSLLPWIDANEDDWIFLGAGIAFSTSAYRTQPFGTRLSLWAGYATRTRQVRLRGSYESRKVMKNLTVGIRGQYSRLDIANFYGLGNETTTSDVLLSNSYYKTDQRTMKVGPLARYALSPSFSIGLYPTLHLVQTRPRPGSLIDSLTGTGYPAKLDYGSVTIDALFDSRDQTLIPDRGMFASVSATLFPKGMHNPRSFLRLDLETKYYHYLAGDGMHVMLRTAGSYIAGDHPWFESSFIGGSETLRGFRRQRFAGDAALSGTLEWRIPLGQIHVLWPIEVGAIVFGDAGRVFLRGEESRRWHSSAGMGFWVHPALWPFTIAVSVAASNERFEFLASFGEPVSP